MSTLFGIAVLLGVFAPVIAFFAGTTLMGGGNKKMAIALIICIVTVLMGAGSVWLVSEDNDAYVQESVIRTIGIMAKAYQ